MSDAPLILFTGMGADERLFAPQRDAFPRLIVPPWITPEPHEPLTHYAERIVEGVDPHEPCFLGGASFGGFVAIEAARHLHAKACFLIGSVRCCEELPLQIRALRKLKHLLPAVPFEWAPAAAHMSFSTAGSWMRPCPRSITRQLAEAKASFLRWACYAVLSWDPPILPLEFPVYHIHGALDRVLPAKNTHPDELVPRAGHLLTLTHAARVNHFLEEKIAECEQEEASYAHAHA
jgi:pimeloyl-ACP methyl ester carboxylesterase